MSSEANSQGDEFAGGPPVHPDACKPAKAEAGALTKEEQDERRAARMVNLILQRSAMRPGEIVEVIVPDDEEEDYVEDPYFMHEDGTPDLEKSFQTLTTTPSSPSIPEMPLVGLCMSILVISRGVVRGKKYLQKRLRRPTKHGKHTPCR